MSITFSLTSPESLKSFEEIDVSSFKNDIARSKFKAVLTKMLARIETPWETTLNSVWIQPALNACIKTSCDCGLFEKWADAGSGEKKGTELAQLVGMDPALMNRLLRHMGATNAIEEVAEDTYKMTPFTASLVGTGHLNAFSYFTDINSPGFRNLPSFFAETKYKNPTDGNNTNWQPTIGKNQTFFEWLGANPKIAQDFQNMLIGYNASKLPVTEFFPIAELVAGWETDKPLLVDVGGGHGADLKNIYDKFDELPPDSLILQDLPGPIEQANLPTPIKKMAHDIFQPQPVKGARAYYLHIVLHDFPDDKAVEILKNIASAMKRGHSKVFIHENIINATKPHPQTTASDLTMMMALSGGERTQATWNAIVADAGLTTVQVWRHPGAIESVLEAELA